MKKFTMKRQYLAMPYAVLSVIFVVVPLFLLLGYALTDQQGNFTFENFIKFFAYWDQIKVMLQSFLIAAVCTVICFLLAYPIAYVLAHSRFNKTGILLMLFIMPMWINFMLRTYALKEILFEIFKMPKGWAAIIIGMVYDYFPFMLLPIYTVLSNIDKSYVEASRDLGVAPVQTFFRITLPLSVPGIVSGCLMVFMPTISTYAIVDMLGDTSQNSLFGNLINIFFGKGTETWNTGSAYAFIMLLLVGLSMLIANLITKGKVDVGAGKGGIL